MTKAGETENPTIAGAQPAVQPKTDEAHIFPDHFASAEEHAAAIRAKRQPFGSFVQKLAYASRPGYHRHWFNDEPGRIDAARNAGYTHVKDARQKQVSRHVGRSRENGGSLRAYLMEIPDEIWLEDKAHEQDRVDQFDKAIGRKVPIKQDLKPGEEEKFYQPKAMQTKITTSLRRKTGSGL